MTSSMKQARLEDRYAKYEYAVVRFHLPDKMVLQAKFRPRETGNGTVNKRDAQVSCALSIRYDTHIECTLSMSIGYDIQISCTLSM